jgi:hypothetical protein
VATLRARPPRLAAEPPRPDDPGETTPDDVADSTNVDTGTTATTAEATTTTAGTGADPQPTTVFALSVGDCVTDEAIEVMGQGLIKSSTKARIGSVTIYGPTWCLSLASQKV